MSLLSVVQECADDLGIGKPDQIVSSTDDTIQQILAHAKRSLRKLADEFMWPALLKRHEMTLLAQEDQGAINTLVGGDFKSLVNETFMNNTTTQIVEGPATPREWSAMKAVGITGPYYTYRLQGKRLLIYPIPATDNVSFEYKSSHLVVSADGLTTRETFAEDSDESILDEHLFGLLLTWTWRKRKGLDYSEDFQEYEVQLRNATGREGSSKTLSLNGGNQDIVPGIHVPRFTRN